MNRTDYTAEAEAILSDLYELHARTHNLMSELSGGSDVASHTNAASTIEWQTLYRVQRCVSVASDGLRDLLYPPQSIFEKPESFTPPWTDATE